MSAAPVIGAPGTPTRVGVAVPAAGSGQRMGGLRKAFLELLGEPVLVHALRPFLADPRVVDVVVALAPDDAAAVPSWITTLDPRVRVVAGGESRTHSVRNAIAAMADDVDLIAVHDAARPLVTASVVSACIDVAKRGVGAVAGCRAVDTMKRVDAERIILDTPPRSELWHAHTPQIFPAAVLRRAYAEATEDGTDDSALVERLGLPVRMVDGGPTNMKVTHPDDVPLAETILRSRRSQES